MTSQCFPDDVTNIVYYFLCQVYQQVLSDQGRQLLDSLVASITAEKSALENFKTERDLSTIFHRISGVRHTQPIECWVISKYRIFVSSAVQHLENLLVFMGNDRLVRYQASGQVTRRLVLIQPVCISIAFVSRTESVNSLLLGEDKN